jgi:stromal membrane-associated protein
MEGDPPEDPSVLDTDERPAAEPTTRVQQDNVPRPATVTQPQRTESSRHQLLSASHLQQQPGQPRLQPPAPAPAPAPVPAPAPPQNDLFNLDFHSPSPVQQQTQPTQPKNAKQDILSLFSTPAPNPAMTVPVQQNLWGQPNQPVQQHIQGMMGQTGTGMWGVSSGWNPPQPQPQANAWGGFTSGVSQQPQQQGNFGLGAHSTSNNGFGGFQQPAAFSTTDIWANNGTPTTANSQQKDAFDDIWGGFK